jgi:hypothetical protein
MNLSEMKDGIYYDIPDNDYQADKTRVRSSQLKTLHETSDYNLLMDKDFAGKGLGLAWHSYLEVFNKNKIMNIQKLTGVKGYDTKKNIPVIEANPDKFCLNNEDICKLDDMIDTLNNRQDSETIRVRGLVNDPDAKKEVTVLFTIGDVKCKCRIDLMIIKDGVYHIWDHKTTYRESIDDFKKDFKYKFYWLQMFFYAIGLSTALGIDLSRIQIGILAYQTVKPNIIYEYPVNYEGINDVEMLIHLLVHRIDYAIRTGKMNGFLPKFGKKQVLGLSTWEINEIKYKCKMITGE